MLFGTPLWFYVFLEPGYKHAADALYLTAAVWFLLLGLEQPRRRYLVAAGACLGLMLATRYANVALLGRAAGDVRRAARVAAAVVGRDGGGGDGGGALRGAGACAASRSRRRRAGSRSRPRSSDEPAFMRAAPPVRLAAGAGHAGRVGVPGSSGRSSTRSCR